MADEILARDQNSITVLGAITDDIDQEIKMLRVDPITKRLLISADLSGVAVTSINTLTGAVTLAAGTNISLDPVGNTITINATGIGDSFETTSKNLKAYPYEIAYTGGGDIDTITYDLGGGLEIVKTFGYTSGDVTTVVLSGDTPAGIDLTKTLSYISGAVDNVVYS